jgi:hypothetical protein
MGRIKHMSQYYRITRRLGTPHRNSVTVTVPLVGPQGPAGPQGEQGPPGEVSGSIAWDNVTDKPTTFPPSAHTHVAADITDFTSAVEAVSPPADWDTLANKPSTFPPSSHGHVAAEISDFSTAAAAAAPVQSVAGKTGSVTLAKADVGLGNVDNTSDTNKPISSATQSALDGKAATSHTHTASQVTDFNTAAAAAAPVQSVNGNTGTVTVTVPSASTATPSALGTAAAGTASEFARADHVHAMPSASDVGAVSAQQLPLDVGMDGIYSDGVTLVYDEVNQTFNVRNINFYFRTDNLLITDPADGTKAVALDVSGLTAETTRTLTVPDKNITIADDADIPDPSSTTPQALGSAAAGTSDDYSRADHIHAAPALNDLSNVSAATPSDNDVLVFDTATSTWVAEAPAASGIAETLLDAKGDLIVASAADTAARLAVGTNGHVLTADSVETTGVKWAALPAGGTKTYAVFTPDNNQPTATAFATLDTRNSIAVLDFDDAATESAVFVGILPEAAALGSGLIVSLRWMATTATSGDVRWSVAWEKSNTDLDSDSFDTATAATATADGTSGIVTVTNITCTTIDSLAAGDLFRLRVQRVGGDGADTMTGDAEVVAVEIRSAA